ncbi:MAG: hypothetical protein H8E43_07860 [Planctomycetia bacterium]|nr:hypothetical protein [Planctomycetia bacterium]
MFSEFKETYLVISGKSIQAFKVLLGWSMDMTKRSNADRDRSRVSHDQAEEEKKSIYQELHRWKVELSGHAEQIRGINDVFTQEVDQDLTRFRIQEIDPILDLSDRAKLRGDEVLLESKRVLNSLDVQIKRSREFAVSLNKFFSEKETRHKEQESNFGSTRFSFAESDKKFVANANILRRRISIGNSRLAAVEKLLEEIEELADV